MFINNFFLFLLLLPKSIYEKMGVNTHHLKAILTTKLMMDERRPPSIQQRQKKKNAKPIKWATLGTMIMSALLGLFFIISFFISNDTVTQFFLFFTFFIFLLASTLITDFTNVLIDIRDNAIILPKPISDKTFLLARLFHIIIHVSKLVLPMTLPSLITVGIKYGSWGVVTLILLIPPVTLFTIFLINALYILILKVSTPEKFKNIISYFQIVFAIVIYGSYQIVPRMINMSVLENYRFPQTSISLLAPPFWFAGSWEFLYHHNYSIIIICAFILSIIMPALSIWIVIKYFAPSFNQKLAMISGSDTAESVNQSKAIASSTKKTFAEILANLFTKKGAERMGFLHAWYITARSRDFKMRVYPAIGYLLVYMVIMILRSRKDMLQELQNQTTSGKFLFLGGIYFISFVIMQALSQIKYSDKYKASFLFYTTPISVPGQVISGAVKSSIIKFYLPLAVLISLFGILFMGIQILPNLLLGMSNQLCICFLIAYVGFVEMPFSRTESITVKSGGFIRGLISMLIPFILATVHYLIFDYTVAVLILLALSMIAVWLVAGSVYNKNWTDLKVGYQD
jgi:ABC-2 type transport system permease protein